MTDRSKREDAALPSPDPLANQLATLLSYALDMGCYDAYAWISSRWQADEPGRKIPC